MQIVLPPNLNSSSLRHLMKGWPSGYADVDLHFNERQWATPTGMVGLACLIDKLRKSRGSIKLSFNNCDTVGYWERMGFFREVEINPPDCNNWVNKLAEGRFAEIRRVGDIDTIDALTQELVAATHTSQDGLQTFSHILSEAMNNVCQHSGAYGFSAAQYWKKTGRVEFCIADSGRGLFDALRLSHCPPDDAEAIRLALKVGVTSNSPNFGQPHMRNRGVGLSCIHRLVHANGGKFEVWSGLGQYQSVTGISRSTQNMWTGTLLTVNMLSDKLTADFRTVMQQLTAELRSIETARRARPPLSNEGRL